jgi:hypothetical protein
LVHVGRKEIIGEVVIVVVIIIRVIVLIVVIVIVIVIVVIIRVIVLIVVIVVLSTGLPPGLSPDGCLGCHIQKEHRNDCCQNPDATEEGAALNSHGTPLVLERQLSARKITYRITTLFREIKKARERTRSEEGA